MPKNPTQPNPTQKPIEKKFGENCKRLLPAILKNPGSNSQRNNSCTATYILSLKQSKSDKQDTQNTARVPRTQSKVAFSYGPVHMDVPVLADQ